MRQKDIRNTGFVLMLIGISMLALSFGGLVKAQTTPELLGVEWYQMPNETLSISGNQVDFFVPGIMYKAVVTLNAPAPSTVTIEIREDKNTILDGVFSALGLYYLGDDLLASKTVQLVQGKNVIEIPFMAKYKQTEAGGVYVRISGVYDVPDVIARLSSGTQIPFTDYYWLNTKMSVDGTEYDNDEYAPVPSGSSVKCYGYLMKSTGEPAAWVDLTWVFVVGDTKEKTTTNADGYFSKSKTAPDWSDYYSCGSKVDFYHVTVHDSNGNLLAWVKYTATAECPEPTPTPTPTPIPAAYINIQQIVGYSIAAAGVTLATYLLRRS